MGTVEFPFVTGQSNIAVCFQMFVLLLLFSSGEEMEEYIKCEMIGGVSPRYLNTFSNLFNVGCTLHTYHSMHCCFVDSATASFDDTVTFRRTRW